MNSHRLPDQIVRLLDGSDLDGGVGFTVELITVDAEGWPGVALLSVGEVLAIDGSTIRLALWPGTRTTANLTRAGRGVLALVHDGAAYTLRIETCRAADLVDPSPRAVFDARLGEVRRDEVSYARLRSGITFDLSDRPAVVDRWTETIAELRRHPECRPGEGGTGG